MKDGKRILEVKIQHIVDESPDTSWLGEYSDRPDGEFSIDRALDESFQGDIDTATDWLDRIEARLSDEYDTLNQEATGELPVTDWMFQVEVAIDTIRETRAEFEAYWDKRDYRYFNPGSVEPFKADASWIPAEITDKQAYWRKAMQDNARADYKRSEEYNRGEFSFIGVKASAKIAVPSGPQVGTLQTIHSGGLWGIESDSDHSYLTEVEQEQLSELKSQLSELGFSKRAIATAFKTIVRASI